MSALPRWTTRSPRLVHLTVAEARPVITDLGLRPATWLVEKADGLSSDRRAALLTEPRAESVWLDVRGHRVRLRDQQPLGSGWTSRLVESEDPAEYLQSLNDHAFLFPSSARGLELLKSKYSGDGLVFEFDTEAVLTDAILASRIRLVDHNPGAMSFDPSVRHLSRSKWHTIESWNEAHPGGKQPSEVMIRGGLSTIEFEDALVAVVEL